MVLIKFSQKWAKEIFEERIRKLWKIACTRAAPDLWVKVFFFRDKFWYSKVNQRWYQYDPEQKKSVEVSHPGLKRMDKARVFFGDGYNFDDMLLLEVSPVTKCTGNYRCAQPMGHGFYDKEWNFIYAHPKIKHCITLKIGESAEDGKIVSLMIHEFKHYLQWKKYGALAMDRKVNGRRSGPIQVEADADKYAKKRTEKLGYNYR